MMKKRLLACLLALVFIFAGQGAVVSSFGYEPAPYAPSNYLAYLEFLNYYEVPDNFVYYEELSFLGTFQRLSVETDKNHNPDFTKDYYYEILPFEPLDDYWDWGTKNWKTTYIVRCPACLPDHIDESFGVEEMPKEQILEIYSTHSDAIVDTLDPSKLEDKFQWGISNEFVFTLEYPNLSFDIYADFLEEHANDKIFSGYPTFENPEYYPPYQQFWSEERRDDMIRTILYATLQQPYKNKYKAVLDSYLEELRRLPGTNTTARTARKAFGVAELSFLGMLSSYQSDEGRNYETGEFRFATNDPEIEIVLRVQDLDSSETWDVPEGMPEGPDLRGEKFCLHYEDFDGNRTSTIYFLGDKIVIVDYQNSKKVTLTTTPESALSEYPMVYDGGGFLSQLLSSKTGEYCAELLVDCVVEALIRANLPALVWGGYHGDVIVLPPKDENSSNVSTDEGTVDATTDIFTEEGETDATASATNTDVTDTPSDGADAASTTDTPADPTPFPWLWVIVPAGVILVGGGTAALLLLRKRKKAAKE